MGGSRGSFAFGGIQRSYSFSFAGIGRLPNMLTPEQMPGIPTEQVAFKAPAANTGIVYIGTSISMSPLDNLDLAAGEWSPYFPVQNLDMLWYYCADATSFIQYVLFRDNIKA